MVLIGLVPYPLRIGVRHVALCYWIIAPAFDGVLYDYRVRDKAQAQISERRKEVQFDLPIGKAIPFYISAHQLALFK